MAGVYIVWSFQVCELECEVFECGVWELSKANDTTEVVPWALVLWRLADGFFSVPVSLLVTLFLTLKIPLGHTQSPAAQYPL